MSSRLKPSGSSPSGLVAPITAESKMNESASVASAPGAGEYGSKPYKPQ